MERSTHADGSFDHGWTLQSDDLTVSVLPLEGGRIASLRSLSSGLEFLTQSRRQGPYPHPGLDAQFRDGPCAGIEECLPTVAACGAETEDGPVADHGDFWQLPWRVLYATREQMTIEADGFSRTLRVRKTMTVEGTTLTVAYSIRNTGEVAQSFLYACHPLFAIDAGDRIVLPEYVRTLRLDYSRHHRLGRYGDRIDWPAAADKALDVARGPTAGTADMLYTHRLVNGRCGIQRAVTGQTLEINFPVETLPYLGAWLCYGGWPDDATENAQYAVALEPTTAPWNSLREAQDAGDAITLEPLQVYAFEISFSVLPSAS